MRRGCFGMLIAGVVAGLPQIATAIPIQLLLNPGNELPLVSGNIQGWTEFVGSNWTRRGADPTPRSGSWYFFAGVCEYGELIQDVNVSSLAAGIDMGSQVFDFSGYVRSYNQASPDAARIVVDYRTASGGVLGRYDTGETFSTTAWRRVADSRAAPAGTRNIRVRLISRRNSGSNNDGYFDDLSLLTEPVVIPEPATLALLGVCGLGLCGHLVRRCRLCGDSSTSESTPRG